MGQIRPGLLANGSRGLALEENKLTKHYFYECSAWKYKGSKLRAANWPRCNDGSFTADQFIRVALEEARTGAEEGGLPVGAALVDSEGRLVAMGRNRRVQDQAVVLHAEIHCLYNSGLATGDFGRVTMYSTLMPYHMCAGAIVLFGIPKVVAGDRRISKETAWTCCLGTESMP